MRTRLLPLALSAGLAPLALGSCVEAPPTIAVDCFTALDPMNCSQGLKSSCERIATSGVFDVALFTDLKDPMDQSKFIVPPGVFSSGTGGYTVFPVVSNHLHTTAQMGNVNGLDMQLKSFDVTLKPGPNAKPTNFPALLNNKHFVVGTNSAVLQPDSKNLHVADVVVIPASILSDAEVGRKVLDAGFDGLPVIAELRPIAVQAGSEVKGPVATFSILLVSGRLYSVSDCPADGVDQTATSTGCILGQDLSSTCCRLNGSIVCGKAVPAKKQ